MKGVAGTAGAVVVIGFGSFAAANVEFMRQEPAEHRLPATEDVAGPPSTNALNVRLSRRLHTRGHDPPVAEDDAIDVNGTVSLYSSVVCRRSLVAGGYRGWWRDECSVERRILV